MRLKLMCPLPQPLVGEPFDLRVVEDRGKSLGEGWRLTPFQPRHALTIARWIQTEQQLRWLAPSTHPPLTAEKIMGWKKSGGEAFVLVKGGEWSPLGYGEINPMRKGGEYLWLGHVIVRPDQRGRGLGRTLLRALLVEAFERRNAMRVALIVFPDNLAALRCYRRVGFSLSGEEIHQFDGEGLTHRLLRLEITRQARRAAGAALPAQGSD
jgi:RimJ/RimL family protein N-acetyltransferase